MTTWLEEFHRNTTLNRYPISLRTRGGIGYRRPDGLIESTFTGHPLHYLEGREWKPITLKYQDGQWEGSDFGWDGRSVTYMKRVLFQAKSITFNGRVYPLEFMLDQGRHRLVCDVPGIGVYEILYSENGVREVLTIPDPIDGLLTFRSEHASKPKELHEKEWHMRGHHHTGESYLITPDLQYPIVIDPDYSGNTSDCYVYGSSSTYATARSTAFTFSNLGSAAVGLSKPASIFFVYRTFMKFDTSGIPDGQQLARVNMNLAASSDSSTNSDFDVVIRKCNWAGQDPVTSGNMDAAFDAALAAGSDTSIWRNTNGMALATVYQSGNLDPAWVSLTGFTYYALISSQDRDAVSSLTNEFIAVSTTEAGTVGLRPTLTVLFGSLVSTGFFAMF